MRQSFPLSTLTLRPLDSGCCVEICRALLALAIALVSTSALGQAATVKPTEPVPSQISVWPDQLLARAYALCMREEVGRIDKGCSVIQHRWFSYAPNTEVDRTFIEEVAEKLSPTSLNE
jgi:hypothetical protein